MRSATVKTGLAAFAAVLVLVALFVAMLPWMASTQIVRDRIAHELSMWSGYRVSLGAAPELDVWPNFRATLNTVAFHDWGQEGQPPVLEAERLEVAMSALAALRGDVVFSTLSVHRPLLRLEQDGLTLSTGRGRLAQAVAYAREIVAANPVDPDRGALPTDTFWTVEFFDGRIAMAGHDENDMVTSLSGRMAWPALNRPASLTATGIWRGENFSVEASSSQPLFLLSGGQAPVKAAWRSSLLDASFEGTADIDDDTSYFDGQASLASPSLQRALEWWKVPIMPGSAIGAVSIASPLQGSAQRLRLTAVTLTLDGSAGRGVLETSLTDSIPAISGTLAFDRLDLRSLLAAFMPIASGQGTINDPIETGFAEQLSLDLRLSATVATFGSIQLGDVAAAAQVKGTLAAFDISDANAFDGALQAGLRIDAAGSGKTVEIRVMADQVDAFALAKASGAERLLPQGRATISATLKGTGHDWSTVMGNAEGAVSATLGPGALSGLDLKNFRERWATGSFFGLSEVAGGAVPFRSLTVKANITGNIARVEKAEMALDGEIATITGIIPYFSRALALSGGFSPLDAEGTPGEAEETFFIGGAWDAPYVLPSAPAGDEEEAQE